MNLVREHQLGGAHFVMDSAFATVELLDELRRLSASVSLSLKSNRTAGFGALYDLATHGLAHGEVRTITIFFKLGASAPSLRKGRGPARCAQQWLAH